MPTVFIKIADYGVSETRILTIRPQAYVSMDDVAESADWAYGLHPVKTGRGFDVADSLDAATIKLGVRLEIADFADSHDICTSVPVHDIVWFSGADAEDSFDLAEITLVARLAIADVADSLDIAEWAFRLPDVPLPSAGQLPGAINVVPNPSLENPDVGLRGWTADAGITLTRHVSDSWVGLACALAEVDIGASPLDVAIASQRGLDFVPTGYWAGSISVKGVAPFVTPVLRFIYRDGTEFDNYGEVGESIDGWTRIYTGTWESDPTKVLESLSLRIRIDQQGAEALEVLLDGAMIEYASAGGGSEYVDGDQGEGHVWMGTPHASPSYRLPLEID